MKVHTDVSSKTMYLAKNQRTIEYFRDEKSNKLVQDLIKNGVRIESFKFQVKLEPFQRALKELQPEIWISGIRGEETEYRRNLGIVSLDDRGILKVSPLFHWTEADVSDYMRKYNLPSCRHYFDPTKIDSQTECGLHLSQFEQGGGI